MDLELNVDSTYYIPGMHTSLAPYLVVPPSFGNKLTLALTNAFAPYAKIALVDQSNSNETASYNSLIDFSDVSNAESRLGRGNIHISESANENEQTFDGMIINVQVPHPEECIKSVLNQDNVKKIGDSLIKFMMNENDGVTIQIQKLDNSNPVVYAVICCENDEECEKMQKEIINLNDEFFPSVLIQGDQSIRAVRGPEFGFVAFAVSHDEQCKKKLGGVKVFVKQICESLSLFGQSIATTTLVDKVIVCLSKFNGNIDLPNSESQLYGSEMSRYAKLIKSTDYYNLYKSKNGMKIIPVLVTDNSAKVIDFLTKALDGEVKSKVSNGTWLIEFGSKNNGFNGFIEVKEATAELPGNSISISLCVPDLDKSFEKVKQYSDEIKVEYNPRNCEWGENMAIFVYESMQITLAQFHGTFKGAFVDSDYSKWCDGHDAELIGSKKDERISYAPRGYGKVTATLETNESIRKCSLFFNNHVFGGQSKVIFEVKKQSTNPEGKEKDQNENDDAIKNEEDDDLELIVLTSKEEDAAITIKKKGDIKVNDRSQIFQGQRLMKYLVQDAADLYEKVKSQPDGIISTFKENGNGEQSFIFKDPTGNHSIFSSISSRLNFSNISKAVELSVANDLTIVNGDHEEQVRLLLDESTDSNGSNKRSVEEAERDCEGEESFESLTKKSKSIVAN